MPEKDRASPHDVLVENVKIQSSHKETSDKQKGGRGTVLFKNINVLKNKGCENNSGQTKLKRQQRNVIIDSGLAPRVMGWEDSIKTLLGN